LDKDRQKIEEQLHELTSTNTLLRTAKEQLALSEKLATVGTLAAGIAHEIGNPMAVLQGYSELLADKDLSEKNRLEYAQAVEDAVQKVSTIIRDLLEFARPVDQSDDTCDVNVAVQRAMNLVAHQPSFRSIDMDLNSPETPLFARINSGRLEQVVLNLLLNASHASPKGSKVQLVTRKVERCVFLDISDTGQGISPAIQSQIFDPFFTTKEPGAGTGLGLSICHNIVTGFGGDISMESVEGEGTTFRIKLPQA
jgi:two-component system NtrC family sensor kinase